MSTRPNASNRATSNFLSKSLSIYMRIYGLGARDSFALVDILQTCQAIVSSSDRLELAYLLPLIFGHLKGLKNGELPKLDSPPQWSLVFNNIHLPGVSEYRLDHAAESFRNATKLTIKNLDAIFERKDADIFSASVLQHRGPNPQKQPLSSIDRYYDLIQTVARFKNPQLGT